MRWIFWLSLLGACQSFRPMTDAERAAFRPILQEPVRVRAHVTIDSDRLRGGFDALLVADPDGPKVRLQLFPDVGEKVLDLIARPDRFVGRLAGERIDVAPENARPDALSLFAFTLLELFAPVTADRVAGVRGTAFRLRPVAGDIDVVRDGETLAFRFGWIGWTWNDGIEAKGFRLSLADVERTPAPDLDPRVFEP